MYNTTPITGVYASALSALGIEPASGTQAPIAALDKLCKKAFGGEKADGFDNITYEHAGNLWDQPGLTDQPEDEFVSLDPKDAAAERGADGSLPARFGRLKAGSVFVDKGVPTASINLAREGIVLDPIAYQGQNPDLGAFELQ